jgi:hypothetical protein
MCRRAISYGGPAHVRLDRTVDVRLVEETDITSAWDGPKLVQTNKDTFREHGQPSNIDPGLGSGCGSHVPES